MYRDVAAVQDSLSMPLRFRHQRTTMLLFSTYGTGTRPAVALGQTCRLTDETRFHTLVAAAGPYEVVPPLPTPPAIVRRSDL